MENLNKSQLKLGIWGGKRKGAAGELPALAEGPTPRAPSARLQSGPGSLRRPRLRLRGGPSAGPPPRAAGAGCREACARFRRHGVPATRPGWGGAAGSRSRSPSSYLSRPGGGLRALSRPALLGGGVLSLPSASPARSTAFRKAFSSWPACSGDGCVVHTRSNKVAPRKKKKGDCVSQLPSLGILWRAGAGFLLFRIAGIWEGIFWPWKIITKGLFRMASHSTCGF